MHMNTYYIGMYVKIKYGMFGYECYVLLVITIFNKYVK